MLRISVAWITVRSSSARVRLSRSKPASRVHTPAYMAGAYCAWIPATCSSAAGSDVVAALQQELTGEQRPVERAHVERGHGVHRLRISSQPGGGPGSGAAPGARSACRTSAR